MLIPLVHHWHFGSYLGDPGKLSTSLSHAKGLLSFVLSPITIFIIHFNSLTATHGEGFIPMAILFQNPHRFFPSFLIQDKSTPQYFHSLRSSGKLRNISPKSKSLYHESWEAQSNTFRIVGSQKLGTQRASLRPLAVISYIIRMPDSPLGTAKKLVRLKIGEEGIHRSILFLILFGSFPTLDYSLSCLTVFCAFFTSFGYLSWKNHSLVPSLKSSLISFCHLQRNWKDPSSCCRESMISTYELQKSLFI